MKCLVIAAGRGARLADRGECKPLTPLLGVPLIERSLLTASRAGLTEFCVVTGYNGQQVRHFLDDLATRRGLDIQHVVNDQWEQGNGLSVLKAKDHLKENFVLLMADHLIDTVLLARLRQWQIGEDEVCLAVDTNRENPLVRPGDVTKVEIEDEKVVRIGKTLQQCDAFDTGSFLCSPAVFAALEQSIAERGDSSLSGGIQVLAGQGKVSTFDVQGSFWIDVDDSADLEAAEWSLLAQLKKPADGPVSRYLNRPLSTRISRLLVKGPVTPNQISLFCFLLSIVAAVVFALEGYWALVAGAILAQFASVVDGCDGEVARLKFWESDFGGWFDAVLDRYSDAFLLFGLTWHVFAASGRGLDLLVGFLAIVGSFMNSYTADKYDSLMKAKFSKGPGIRIGRDVRIFLVFLGALCNLPLGTLLVLAILMNLENIRRVVVCYRNE
jgi:choline kinase/phosphatidylglycerophosphate synthase